MVARRASFHTQAGYDVRFEWGREGVEWLAPDSSVLVIVDVLSFSTCVEVAVARGATVYPYRWHDATAEEYARRLGAHLAVRRDQTTSSQPYSLSPVTLQTIQPGERLVLPSPNGSTLAWGAAEMGATVLAGCLRNATAVARAARAHGGVITVIAAGERWWQEDRPLRPAVEDLIGAGAILTALGGDAPSPEVLTTMAAFAATAPRLREHLLACGSGRELQAGGYAQDVEMAAVHDVSAVVPRLHEGAFIDAAARATVAPG